MNRGVGRRFPARGGWVCLWASGLALAGCRNPSVGVTVQPFVNSAALSGEAVKIGIHAGDVFGGLCGMEDVAAGLDVEYSRYRDADGVTWRYWRVASPVVSLRKRGSREATSTQERGAGAYDALKGSPALSDEYERLFLGMPPRRWALLLGLSLKGLESDGRADGEKRYLFLGPSWGFGSLWSPRAGRKGLGFIFEADTGIDLYSGRLYAAASLGLWLTFGRARQVPFTTEYTLPPEPPLPPQPVYPSVEPFVEGIVEGIDEGTDEGADEDIDDGTGGGVDE